MPTIALNHINLRARRELIDKLLDFYVEVVGLRIGERPAGDFYLYWLYLGNQPVLHLVGDDDAWAEGDTRAGSFDHVAFTCENMTAFEQHLQRLNVPYRRLGPPGMPPRQLFITDPAGNGVELNFASPAK